MKDNTSEENIRYSGYVTPATFSELEEIKQELSLIYPGRISQGMVITELLRRYKSLKDNGGV